MTVKEWEKFVKAVESDRRITISGYIMLYPEAIKSIDKPSDLLKEYAEKKRDLFTTTESGKIDGEFLIYTCRFQQKIRIHRKYIKSLRIYKYNH